MSRPSLVLAAHGSDAEASLNERVYELARTMIRHGVVDEAVAAFHQGAPRFSEAIDQLSGSDVIVVPFMTSQGYYCTEVLPRELRRNCRYHDVRVVQTQPVGAHPGMVDLMETRATEVCRQAATRTEYTTLVIVGHGTSRNRESRETTVRIARTINAQCRFGECFEAFLDEEPYVESIPERSRFETILVLPFLISGGPHATRDVPRRLNTEIDPSAPPPWRAVFAGRNYIFDQAIGKDDRMAEIISDSIKSAENSMTTQRTTMTDRPLRIGTRGSKMALVQANAVATALGHSGVASRIIPIATTGDRRLDLPISDLPSYSPFTDDIDEALAQGQIDLAVHSLKDLPLEPNDHWETAAILLRGDADECFVSRDKRTLSQMPTGSRIGTSGPRRRAQLLAFRPDLVPISIRGPVDARLDQIDRGEFDGAILATVGLQRLELTARIAERLPIESFLPAPGQAAIAITVRRGDDRTREFAQQLHDEDTARAVECELALLRRCEEHKEFVVGAFAINGARLRLWARLVHVDGGLCYDLELTGRDPQTLAAAASENLFEQARLSRISLGAAP